MAARRKILGGTGGEGDGGCDQVRSGQVRSGDQVLVILVILVRVTMMVMMVVILVILALMMMVMVGWW